MSPSALHILAIAAQIGLTSGLRQPLRRDSLRPVATIISLVDSETPCIASLQRLIQILNDEAAAVHIHVVFFDLATAPLLPDTLLVLSVKLGPGRASSSMAARWLVPFALFVPRTPHTHFPLRILCERGSAGAVDHPGGMSDEAVRQFHEEWYRKMVRGALECLIHET